jgi:copper chaperone CopZ
MSNQEFTIDGMMCEGCVNTVKRMLEKTPGVKSVSVQLASPHARIEAENSITVEQLNQSLEKLPQYRVVKEVSV